jgi:hypothetical protein
MNVRFFGGTKKQYLSLSVPRNPLGLYFCADTKELFWGDKLLTDGTRIIATEADLPVLEQAADGITYFVEASRNGYVISPDRSKWVKVINAHTSSSDIKAISFAGIEMEEVDGVFTIDRRCAREALGFIVPDGLEDADIEIVTKEYVDSQIAKIPGADIDLSEYVKQEDLEDYATEQYVIDAIAVQVPVEDLAKKEEVVEVKTKLEAEILPTIQEIILPTVQKAATQEWVKEQGYLTEHQSLVGLATEEFVNRKIAEAELADKDVDLDAYYTKSEVEALIPEVPTKISELENDSGYITQQEITSTYITEQQIRDTYITKEAVAEAYVTEERITEVVETKVETVIQEKIDAGEISVNADAINYDTW